MANPAYRSKSAYANGTNTVTVSKPAGTAQDDVMIAFITPNADNQVITAPSGWTKDVERTGGSFNPGYTVYWKVAGGAEPSTYDWSCLGFVLTGVILSYSGADTSTPINVSAVTNISGGASTSFVAPTVTTTVANCTLLCFFGTLAGAGGGSPFTPPGSMTEREDQAAISGNACDFSICDEALGASGATGTRTATANSSQFFWTGSVALAPSSGGGGGGGTDTLMGQACM